MQTDNVDGQMTLSDLGIYCGRTCLEQQVRESTKERTSAVSSKKSPKSSKKMPIFLTLRKGDGRQRDASSWNTEALLGGYTIVNGGVSRSEGSASLSWLTSVDSQHHGFCLTLNLSEQPRVANPTLLSEILETDADSKYNLSAKACLGILRRAEKRGKALPEILKQALEKQANEETS